MGAGLGKEFKAAALHVELWLLGGRGEGLGVASQAGGLHVCPALFPSQPSRSQAPV